MPRDWYGPQPHLRRGDQPDRVKVRWVEPCGHTRFFRWLPEEKRHETLEVCADGEIEQVKESLRARGIETFGHGPLYSVPGSPMERFDLGEAPAGSLWDAVWMHQWPDSCGADGLALVVKLPNKRDWHIDSRASNCDSKCADCGKPYHAHDIYGKVGCPKFVESRPHKCWCRHGDPKTGMLHVDKSGVTCGAGAGSILAGDYHGFLHSGYLTKT